jgi:hypothetical protein
MLSCYFAIIAQRSRRAAMLKSPMRFPNAKGRCEGKADSSKSKSKTRTAGCTLRARQRKDAAGRDEDWTPSALCTGFSRSSEAGQQQQGSSGEAADAWLLLLF